MFGSGAVAERVAAALGLPLRAAEELSARSAALDAAVVVDDIARTVERLAAENPAVVGVDPAGVAAVVLRDGALLAADFLAREVAAAVGGVAVGASAGRDGLDVLAAHLGAVADGDLTDGDRALRAGTAHVQNPLGFPLPPLVTAPPERAEHTITISDRAAPGDAPGWTVLVPPTLVVGVGTRAGAPASAVAAALHRVQDERGYDLRAVRAVATVDGRAAEPGIVEVVGAGLLRSYPAEVLARVAVPHPSATVERATGTPSVAEAAALHAAAELSRAATPAVAVRTAQPFAPGPPPVELVVEKLVGDAVTVAVARIRPRGRLIIAGSPPGDPDLLVPRAAAILRGAAVVLGTEADVDRLRHVLHPDTDARDDVEDLFATALDLAERGVTAAVVTPVKIEYTALADSGVELIVLPSVR